MISTRALAIAATFWSSLMRSRAFVAKSKSFVPIRSPRYGISEWRDIFLDLPGTGDDRRLGMEDGPPPKKVCILPFPYEEVLLQGETKQLRLYEDRFINLFEDTMANHEGVVAMGLLAHSGIIQTVPLCEVVAYNRMEGFGIFATIRVVGRASLLDIVEPQEPYLTAVCAEVVDEIPPNLELPNLVASNIENYIVTLSNMEHHLEKAQKNSETELDKEYQEKERRIKIAKLDDRFFQDSKDDEDEELEDKEVDRRGRFRQAYEVALASDTQGYCFGSQEMSVGRSPQELNALSWAAFSTDVLPEEDATYRIQALDSNNLLERLKLASLMLKEKKEKLKRSLELCGITDFSDDVDSSREDQE